MEPLSKGLEIAKLFQEIMVLFRHYMGNHLEEKKITFPQMMVMGVLSKEGTLKITDLSAKLSLPNSTVSGLVDRLEELGLVERKRSEDDRRVVYVNVTEKYANIHESFRQYAEEKLSGAFNQASPEEHAKVIDGLEILKRLLCKQVQSKPD